MVLVVLGWRVAGVRGGVCARKEGGPMLLAGGQPSWRQPEAFAAHAQAAGHPPQHGLRCWVQGRIAVGVPPVRAAAGQTLLSKNAPSRELLPVRAGAGQNCWKME